MISPETYDQVAALDEEAEAPPQADWKFAAATADELYLEATDEYVPTPEQAGHDRASLLRLVSGGNPFVFLSVNDDNTVLVDVAGLDQEEAVAVLSEIAYALIED